MPDPAPDAHQCGLLLSWGQVVEDATQPTGPTARDRRRGHGCDQAEVPQRSGCDVLVVELGTLQATSEQEQREVIIDEDHPRSADGQLGVVDSGIDL